MALDLVTFTNHLSTLITLPAQNRIAVAVSGGPDSMVLCHLMSHITPNITALIVDHGLRAESAEEADLTKNRLLTFGITSEILRWSGDKPKTRIQETARQARHRLLQDWCQEQGVIYLFMAHHFDDQWETLYMRLRHGSGPQGLMGIQPLSFRSFGLVIRPLLSTSKSDILGYADELNIPYVTDSSNTNPVFERGRIRQNPVTAEQKLPRSSVPKLIQEAQDKTQGIVSLATTFILNHLIIYPSGVITLNRRAFYNLAREARYYLIQKISSAVLDYPYPMPKSKIDKLVQDLLSGRRSTLAGWLYTPRQNQILITREQRGWGDLTFIPHKSYDHNFPSYAIRPSDRSWIQFKNPLT